MTKERVNEIDFLRFFAALSVVFFHYAFRGAAADGLSPLTFSAIAPIAQYGYLGVELFFMISGFVILMTASGGSLRSFIISRMVRLYPAFWACCLLTFSVAWLADLPQFQVNFKQLMINLPMVNEFIGVASIDSAYWSLFVEMKFYAMVALILIIGRIHQIELWLILWLGSSAINQYLHNSRLEYYFLTNYSAFFIAGASFYLIWSLGVSTRRLVLLLLAWVLCVHQALAALPGFAKHYQVLLSEIVVTAVVTMFFVVMGLIAMRKTGQYGRRSWGMVGAVTYPLYLLHQNLGYIVFNLADRTWNAYLVLAVTIVAMIMAAYLVHQMMERRFAQAFKRMLNRVLDSLLGLKPGRTL